MSVLLPLSVFFWAAWFAYFVLVRWDSFQKTLNTTWLFKFRQEGNSWDIFLKRAVWEALLRPIEKQIAKIKGGVLQTYLLLVSRWLRRAGVATVSETQFLGSQILGVASCFPVCWVFVGSWTGGVMASLCTAGLGPLGWLYLRAQKREQEAMRFLPEALELLSVGMEAGLDFGAALKVYVQKGPPGLMRGEFSRVLQDLSTGKTRQQALQGLLERMPFEFLASPLSTILQGLKLGAGIVSLLKAQAEHLRGIGWEAVQKKAQEAPVKLLFPLMVFIFPTIFLVLFGPFAISLIR